VWRSVTPVERLRKQMKAPRKTPDTVRLTLDLSSDDSARLAHLTAEVGATSKAQVVREALRLYDYMVQRSRAGDALLARTPEGGETTIVLLGSAPPPTALLED